MKETTKHPESMLSRLFKEFANLPGINWFNHRDKMEYTTEKLEPIRAEDDFYEIKRRALKYFQHIQAQNQYIRAVNKMLDSFDEEIARWDKIQAEHEQSPIVKELQVKLQQRNQEIARMKRELEKSQSRKRSAVIAPGEVDKLIAVLERLSPPQGGTKIEKSARQWHNSLHNFLRKLQTYAPEINVGETNDFTPDEPMMGKSY